MRCAEKHVLRKQHIWQKFKANNTIYTMKLSEIISFLYIFL